MMTKPNENPNPVYRFFQRIRDGLASLLPESIDEDYTSRRKEIADSDEPIEGIFYIIDNKIVPDYVSECLFSEANDRDNPRKRRMYHDQFYPNYIRTAYRDAATSHDHRSLPRGRIEKVGDNMTSVFLDHCYFKDEIMIHQIITLYRLRGNISVISAVTHRCPACSDNKNNTYKTYNLH